MRGRDCKEAIMNAQRFVSPFAQRFDLRVPVVQAPMAGGPTTPALVAAVSNAGALGSFAAALLSLDPIREAAAEIRLRTDLPFAINLFSGGFELLRPVDPGPM